MNLFACSLAVLGALFGVLFAVAAAVLAYYSLPVIWAVGPALLILGLEYFIAPTVVEWVFKIRWITLEELPDEVGEYLQHLCGRWRLCMPKLGIIEDGNPNAFTFGHFPADARLVVTRGLLDMLNEDEQKTVFGHEMGHIRHWDFVVMTVAAMVPVLLYWLYRATYDTSKTGSRQGRAALVGAVAYIAYRVSEYLVLLLSRFREYYADEFAAMTTRNPNALARALVKIAYGLARAPEDKENKLAPVVAQTGKALGILDHKVASNLALAAAGSVRDRTITASAVINAMKWDLFNPWGNVYELSSTHPLPGKRVRAMLSYAHRLGQKPVFDLPAKPPVNLWPEFRLELSVFCLPAIGALVGAGVGWLFFHGEQQWLHVIAAVILGYSAGELGFLWFTHPQSRFPHRTVESLVQELAVSRVRAIPCTLEGTVIGRGVPGLYWSKDLVLQDETGFIVLDYEQPLTLFDFLFGLFRAESMIGKHGVATGWFRRTPRPVFELLDIRCVGGNVEHCWAYTASVVLALLGVAIGIAGVLIPFTL